MKTMVTLIAALTASLSFAQAQTAKVGWSTGYWAGWIQGSYPATSIRWDAYTHMCHFSITPNNDGSVKMDMGLTAVTMRALVAEAKKHNVKSLICVGGAGTGGAFQAATANATTRMRLVKAIIAFQQQYGYDGVDMDWEELGGATVGYQALHREMRAELDKIDPKILLTVAIDYQVINAVSPIHAVFNQMNAMSYWTQPANMEASYMKGFVDKGVPRSKLGVGIGFDYTERRPEIDCSAANVKAKCDYAIAMAYGGVMVWAIEKDKQRYTGQEPSTNMLATYKPTAPSALHRQDPRLRASGPVLGIYTLEGRLVADLSKKAHVPGVYFAKPLSIP